MDTHYFGIRLGGKLARFTASVRDDEFLALTRDGLPEGWVAWHIPDGENVDNSDRCRSLRKLPIVVIVSGGLAAFPVPEHGPVHSPYPTPHPGDILSGTLLVAID